MKQTVCQLPFKGGVTLFQANRTKIGSHQKTTNILLSLLQDILLLFVRGHNFKDNFQYFASNIVSSIHCVLFLF